MNQVKKRKNKLIIQLKYNIQKKHLIKLYKNHNKMDLKKNYYN